MINPHNESFPEDFYIEQPNLHNFSIWSNESKLTSYIINSPLPGFWFAAVHRGGHGEVIKKVSVLVVKKSMLYNYVLSKIRDKQ